MINSAHEKIQQRLGQATDGLKDFEVREVDNKDFLNLLSPLRKVENQDPEPIKTLGSEMVLKTYNDPVVLKEPSYSESSI